MKYKKKKKVRRVAAYLIGGIVVAIFFLNILKVRAMEDISYMESFSGVTLSPDGKAWTTDYMDKTNERLPEGYTVSTGITSRLQSLKEGEHYYYNEASGEVPIGQWKIAWSPAQCIHNFEEQIINGFQANAGICEEYYNNGWNGYCADCGEKVTDIFIYGKSSTIGEIVKLPARSKYVYFCPHCGGLEQGAHYVHYCKEISYNCYTIHYEKNAPKGTVVEGYMPVTRHMFNNADIYEGKSAAEKGYTDMYLRRNSYTCQGYVLKGWNTLPDGSGQEFLDGQAVINLSSEEDGQVVLYAQWEPAKSTLVIDAKGGTYNGENIFSVEQDCGSKYVIQKELLEAPKGYQVQFIENGGSSVQPIQTVKSFFYWKTDAAMKGDFQQNIYTFPMEKECVDYMEAQYLDESFVLPNSEKEGEVLVGWYKDEFCSPETFIGKAGEKINVSEDTVLYAKWTTLLLTSVKDYSVYGGAGAVDLSWNMEEVKGKVYKLFQSLDNTKWNPIYTSDTDLLQRSELFGIDRQGEEYVIPHTGYYRLWAYGAQGGDFSASNLGGKGGEVSAEFWLNEGDILTFFAGERGGIGTGGKNGNQADGGTALNKQGGGGGAATEIYLTRGDVQTPLLIAGGGSGAGENNPGKAGGMELTEIEEKAGVSGMQSGSGGGAKGGQIIGDYIQTTLENPGMDNIALKSAWTQVFPKNTQIYVNWTKQINYSEYPMLEFGAEILSPYFRSPKITVGSLARKIEISDTEYSEEEYHYGTEVNEMPATNCAVYHDTYQVSGGFARRFTAEYPSNSNTNVVVSGIIDGWGSWLSGSIRFKIYDADTGELRHDKTYVNGTARGRSTAPATWNIGVWGDFNIEGMENVKIEIDIYGSAGESYYTAKVMDTFFYGNKITIEEAAMGGTSYIHSSYGCKTPVCQGGVNEGDGYAVVQSLDVGYLKQNFLQDVPAKDMKAPGKITDYNIEVLGEGDFQVIWKAPEDCGTDYYHKVCAMDWENNELKTAAVSNVTCDTLTSGIKQYLYYLDKEPFGKATEEYKAVLGQELWIEDIQEEVYLHIAAVDAAGNIGETLDILIEKGMESEEFVPEDSEIMTKQLVIKDTEFVHAVNEKLYYVKADGQTRHVIVSEGCIAGKVEPEFQISHMGLSVIQNHRQEWLKVSVPHGNILLLEERFSNAALEMQVSEGDSVLFKAATAGAVRKNYGTDLVLFQSFTVEAEAAAYEIFPQAEVSFKDRVFVSAEEKDLENGLRIIPDSTPPEIMGLEALQEFDILDMEKEHMTLRLSAQDELSGLEEFCVYLKNNDNHMQEEFVCDEMGEIVLNIEKENPLFWGEIEISAAAIDKVGNADIIGKDGMTFMLNTQIYRQRNPQESVFKTGDGAVLEIITKGYVEKIEVIFPEEMTAVNPALKAVYEYPSPYLKKIEMFQFHIPLGIMEKEYEILVKAYKNGEVLDARPVITVVKGSVLDELRTRIRNNG